MALPGNTNYDTTGSQASFAGLSKMFMKNTAASQKSSTAGLQSSVGKQFNPQQAIKMFVKRVQPTEDTKYGGDFTPGTQIGPSIPERSSPLPGGSFTRNRPTVTGWRQDKNLFDGSSAPQYTPTQIGAREGSWIYDQSGGGQYVNNPVTGETATVLQVIDGDTIEVSLNGKTERVRYVGINTPEVFHSNAPGPIPEGGWEPGNIAKSTMEGMLPVGSQVTLEKDVTDRDVYDRLLRYVWKDNLLVGQNMMQRDMAKTMQFPADIKYPGRALGARNSKNITPTERKILGKLSPQFYRVDYIVPIWAGGDPNSLQNMQILDNATYAKKAAAESVPLSFFVNGKYEGTIEQQRAQARADTMMWKDKDTSILPSQEEIDKRGGYVPFEIAQKVSEKWKEAPGLSKTFWPSLKENMANFGSSWVGDEKTDKVGHEVGTFSKEFAKGLVGGFTAGIMPGTEASEGSGWAGTLGNLAGNMTGMVIGMGKFAKGLGQVWKGAKITGSFVKNIFRAEKITSNVLKTMTTGEKMARATIDVGKVSGQSLALGKTVKHVTYNTALMAAWGQMGVGMRELTNQEEFAIENHTKQFMTDVVYGAGTSIWGQSLKGYVGVASAVTGLGLIEGQDIEPALTNAAMMTAFHSMGFRGQEVAPGVRKGGFTLGGPRSIYGEYQVPFIQEQATKQATATFYEKLGGNLVSPIREGQIVPEKIEFDLNRMNGARIRYQAMYPRDLNLKGIPEIKTQADAINFLEQAALKEVKVTYLKGGKVIPLDQLKKEFQRVTASANHLYNMTLEPSLRAKKERADVLSLGESIKPKGKIKKLWDFTVDRQPANAAVSMGTMQPQIKPEFFKNKSNATIPKDAAESLGQITDLIGKKDVTPEMRRQYAKQIKNFKEGSSAVTGFGEHDVKGVGRVQLDETSRQNLDKAGKDMYKIDPKTGKQIPKPEAEREYEPVIVFTNDAETVKLSRMIQMEEIWNSKESKSTLVTPEDTLRAFLVKRGKDGSITYESAGYFPQAGRMDIKNPTHMNATFDMIAERLRRAWVKSTDSATLKKAFEGDRAFNGKMMGSFVMDPKVADKLFAMKDKVAGMSTEQIIATLNPPYAQKTRHSVENSSIAAFMHENGLNNFVVDTREVWGIDDAGRERYEPKNPYADFFVTKDDAIRSLAMQDAKPESKLERAIQKLASAGTKTDKSGSGSVAVGEDGLPIIQWGKIASTAKPKGEPVIDYGTGNYFPKKRPSISNIKKAINQPEKPKEKIVVEEEKPVIVEEEKPTETFDTLSDGIATGGGSGNAPSGQPIHHTDILSELDGIIKVATKAVDKKLKGLPRDSAEANQLRDFNKGFTVEALREKARVSFETNGGDQDKSFNEFMKKIRKEFTSLDLEDPGSTVANRQAFLKRFNDAVYNESVNIITTGDDGVVIGVSNSNKAKSPMERITGVETVYYRDSEGAKSPDMDDMIFQKFYDKGYVPFWYDSDPGSLMGFKFDSKMAGGKKIMDEGARSEFIVNLFKKMGFEVGEDNLNSMIKRTKTLNTKEQIAPIKSETWNVNVITNASKLNKTVRETTKDFDKTKVSPVVKNGEKVLKELGDKFSIDGTMYTSPEHIARIAKSLGFTHVPKRLKPTQTFKDPVTGKLFHQKLELRAWEDYEKASLEQALGKKLGENEFVTFEDNVKIGFGKVGTNKGNYFEVPSPSDSFTFQYNKPHDPAGSLSAGSYGSKVPPSAGISSPISEKYKPIAQNLIKLSNEIQNSAGGLDIEKIWRKYPEFRKDKWMANLYGESLRSAQHGAGLSQLGQSLVKDLNKALVDMVYSGKFVKSDVLKIKPDMMAKIINFKTGERGNLDSGEIMVPAKTFIRLYGEDAYNELVVNLGKPGAKDFYAMALRYPTLKDTSMAKVKLLIAELHGNKQLGEDQMIANSADTMKWDFDTDGDTLQLFRIDKKGELTGNGVPYEQMEYFVSQQQKGELIFPTLTKLKKVPFDGGPDTYSKLIDMQFQNFKGNEAINITSAKARIMRLLRDNKFMARFSEPNKSGVRMLSFFYNGKQHGATQKVYEMKTNKEGKKVTQFPSNPGRAFDVEVTFGPEKEYMMGEITQEAVDSVGTNNLINRAKDFNGISDYLAQNLFTNAKDPIVQRLIHGETSIFQTPYQLGTQGIAKLPPYIKRIKELKEAGGTLGPTEEISLQLEGLKNLDFLYNNPKGQKERTVLGENEVKETFKAEYDQMRTAPSKLLTEFQNRFLIAKAEMNNVSKLKDFTATFYKDLVDKGLIKDVNKKEFAVWAATSPDSVVSAKNGIRLVSIMNETPEVAKTFFAGELKHKTAMEADAAKEALLKRGNVGVEKIRPDIVYDKVMRKRMKDGKVVEGSKVKASFEPDEGPNGTVHLFLPLIKEHFSGKAWKNINKNRRELPADTFDNLEQYTEYLVQHEIAHKYNNKFRKDETDFEWESHMNDLALEEMKLTKNEQKNVDDINAEMEGLENIAEYWE